MKRIFPLLMLLFLMSNHFCNAQWYALKKKKYESNIKFDKDENGKIIFYGVVSGDTVPARDTLWLLAQSWIRTILNEKGDKVTFEEMLSGTIEAQVSYLAYVESIISKIPHGKISYKVSIDIKNKKYRYTFTEFEFQEYKQNRQDFKYYPVNGKPTPLEKERMFGYQGAWDSHRYNMKKKMEAQILNLKTQMKRVIKKPEAPKTDSSKKENVIIKTKDW